MNQIWTLFMNYLKWKKLKKLWREKKKKKKYGKSPGGNERRNGKTISQHGFIMHQTLLV